MMIEYKTILPTLWGLNDVTSPTRDTTLILKPLNKRFTIKINSTNN